MRTSDSTVFTSAYDSAQVVIYTVFCNDGMSDFVYTSKIKIVYKGQLYKGCGIVF